jgi:hypothetical protein
VSGDKLEVVVVVVLDDFDFPRGFFIAERAGGGGRWVRARVREWEASKEWGCEWGGEEEAEVEEEGRGTLVDWERGLCVLRCGVGAEEDMDVVVTVVGVGEDDDSRSRRGCGCGG